MKKILIFGAASAIASETAKRFAAEKADLFLVDLNLSRLEATKDDILARFETNIHLKEMNALEYENHDKLFEEAAETLGGLDDVLIAHGTLPDQDKALYEPKTMEKELNINYVSVVSLAQAAANFFEKQKRGCVAVISSVAGDRGRQSNYLYGSAKGGVTAFLQGLRNRMDQFGIKVITIKPGLVDTPMTAHLPKNPLYSKPEDIGKIIYNAMKKGKEIVYAPSFWRFVMLGIIHTPEAIFKKLKL